MKLGADPEIFLVDAAGAFVSAIGKIGGSKEAPRPLPIGDGYAVQEDNVALEFNIPPADDADQFVAHITKAREYLAEQVSKMNLKFSTMSATMFPEMELLHPMAQVFGCDPDFNAWKNGAVNPKPKADDWRLRSCGGHVHIGFPFDSKKDVIDFTKYLDLYLGVPSVIQDDGILRKQLYGMPGAFRYKPFGMEYRVLSNYWIFRENLIKWVWEAVAEATWAWEAEFMEDKDKKLIVNSIKTNNKDEAYYLIDKYDLKLAA